MYHLYCQTTDNSICWNWSPSGRCDLYFRDISACFRKLYTLGPLYRYNGNDLLLFKCYNPGIILMRKMSHLLIFLINRDKSIEPQYNLRIRWEIGDINWRILSPPRPFFFCIFIRLYWKQHTQTLTNTYSYTHIHTQRATTQKQNINMNNRIVIVICSNILS